MRYMNGYDIDRAARRFAGNPVLSEAVRAVASLKDWTGHNSDGWAYWRPPLNAAARLIELITGDGTYEYEQRIDREVTPAMLAKALRPVKAFRTKVTKITADNPLYGQRNPMPWFDITDAERAVTAGQAEREAQARQEARITAMAGRFAPVLDEYAFSIRQGVGIAVPGSRTTDVARKLAEIATA